MTKDRYHDWYMLYDKLSVEINPDPEELKQLFNQESPIDPINLSGLELKFEAATREQTVIEKTMSPYQLYALDNPLWTNGLSAQNISGIIAKTIGIRKLSKSEFENAYKLAKENVYAQLRR